MSIVHMITFLVETNSFLSFFSNIVTPFYGTHCARLTHLLLEIRYMIPTSNHFITFFITTFFIKGFSLHYCYALSLLSSFIYILCIHNSWLIPWIYDIFHPIAFFLPFMTLNDASTFISDNLTKSIMGNVNKYPNTHTLGEEIQILIPN